MGMISHIQWRQSVPKSGRSEWGGARNLGVYQTTARKKLLLKGYFCPKQGLSALNFPGGAQKVVGHMHQGVRVVVLKVTLAFESRVFGTQEKYICGI